MIIKIKVIPSKKNEWVGWFGENMLKVRLITSQMNDIQPLLNFLERDLGILPKSIRIIKIVSNEFEIEFPDIAWELFLSIVK